jgi:hypothetical protein
LFIKNNNVEYRGNVIAQQSTMAELRRDFRANASTFSRFRKKPWHWNNVSGNVNACKCSSGWLFGHTAVRHGEDRDFYEVDEKYAKRGPTWCTSISMSFRDTQINMITLSV